MTYKQNSSNSTKKEKRKHELMKDKDKNVIINKIRIITAQHETHTNNCNTISRGKILLTNTQFSLNNT